MWKAKKTIRGKAVCIKKQLLSGTTMEKRKYLRIEISNLSVEIADGARYFKARICNITRYGMCLHIRSKHHIHLDKKIMSIVISGKLGRFKLDIRPIWHKNSVDMRSIGVEIIDPSSAWREFVMVSEWQHHKNILTEVLAQIPR